MKDLITTIASVLILSLFFMQFITNMRAFTCMMDVEHCIREISYESEKYDSESDILKRLNNEIDWITLTPIVKKNKIEEDYTEYEVVVPITNISPKEPLKYTTKCIVKKEKILEHEKYDNYYSTCTDFNTA